MVGARAHKIEARIKITMLRMRRFLRPKMSPSFPHKGAIAVDVRRNAVPTQVAISSPLSSFAIVGRAVETMLSVSKVFTSKSQRQNNEEEREMSEIASHGARKAPT